MKSLTLSPVEHFSGDENYIPQFFENYSPSLIQEKICSFFKAKMSIAEPTATATIAEDVIFYKDLMRMVDSLKYLAFQQPICFITPSFTERTLVSVEGVVNLIKQAIPVGLIYNLSKSKDELDLIVVLEKSCTTAYNEFESIIDLALLGYQKGTCTVHNYGLLNTLISNGHIFYATACIKQHIVYRKSTDELFAPVDAEVFQAAKAMAQCLFKSGMEKATSFYKGAQNYFDQGENEMAIFMLHQACELTYRCLLNVLRGKEVKCHSPGVLRKHLKRFAPEIIGVFSLNEDVELEYLQVLEEAYVKSRYNLSYRIDLELITLLNEKVGLLQLKAHELFGDRMDVLASIS